MARGKRDTDPKQVPGPTVPLRVVGLNRPMMLDQAKLEGAIALRASLADMHVFSETPMTVHSYTRFTGSDKPTPETWEMSVTVGTMQEDQRDRG